MIVSSLWKFVYLGVPKTASTSLHEWLSQPLLCERRWRPEDGGQHEMEMPAGAAGFFIFASVRNPYSRAVSLWRHSAISGPSDTPPVRAMNFQEFVAWLPVAPPFYGASQTEWLGGARLDAAVRIERLESVLELPPFAPLRAALCPIPRRNATNHHAWQNYYDRWTAEAVRSHFCRDFEMFRYDAETG